MSNPSTSSTAGVLARMAAESAARIAEADAKAVRAQVAFAAGKFEDFYAAEYGKAAEAILDEYERDGPIAAG